MFDLLMVEDVRPQKPEASHIVDDDSTTSRRYQDPPARNNIEINPEIDIDAEDIDQLSSTDDDLVGEAFEHLKTAGNVLDEDDDDEQEEEIVWDPR